MKIARVFPRRTRATPNDDLVFTNCPPMFALEIDEVHISVAFTYDMKHAEWLEMQWRALGVPVKMGGPADYEPLVNAGRLLQDAGFKMSSHIMCCYVLIGYRGDTFEKAEKRLIDTIKAGFVPYAMLFKDRAGNIDTEWAKFQREWCRPIIVMTKIAKVVKGK